MPCSRANFSAPSLPSMPRMPKPPGTQIPSTSASAFSAPSGVSQSSAGIHFRCTFASFAKPPARSASATDRRVKLLSVTPEGQTLLADMEPGVNKAQARMLEPLSDTEKPVFLDMLNRLVLTHNDVSRTPTEGAGVSDG